MSWNLWNSMHSLKYHGIHGIPYIPMIVMEIDGIPWCPWNSIGNSANSMEFHGIRRQPRAGPRGLLVPSGRRLGTRKHPRTIAKPSKPRFWSFWPPMFDFFAKIEFVNGLDGNSWIPNQGRVAWGTGERHPSDQALKAEK